MTSLLNFVFLGNVEGWMMKQIQTTEDKKKLWRLIRRFGWISALVNFALAIIGATLLWKFTPLSDFPLALSFTFIGLSAFEELFLISILRSHQFLMRWQAILLWILSGIACAIAITSLVFLLFPQPRPTKPMPPWTDWRDLALFFALSFQILPWWFLVEKKLRTLREELE